MGTYRIEHHANKNTLFGGDFDSLKQCVEAAVDDCLPLAHANLRGAQLRGAELPRANLNGALLAGADLSCADLGLSSLISAHLQRANLSNADLYSAAMMDANLVNADLTNATLTGANLVNADLHGTGLVDAGHELRGFRFVGQRRHGINRVLAGCRDFTLEEAKAHWQQAHADEPNLRRDCLARVALIESILETN